MTKGRGSGEIILLLCILVLYFEMAHAKTYVVGDAAGWTFYVADWPKGKRFKAGDLLEFNYSPYVHNLVIVNKDAYDKCKDGGRTMFNSGHDLIELGPGWNYFICTFTKDHCTTGGMKIAVYAAS